MLAVSLFPKGPGRATPCGDVPGVDPPDRENGRRTSSGFHEPCGTPHLQEEGFYTSCGFKNEAGGPTLSLRATMTKSKG